MNVLITPHGAVAKRHIQNGSQDIAFVTILGEENVQHIFVNANLADPLRAVAKQFEEWDPDQTISFGEIQKRDADVVIFLGIGDLQKIRNMVLGALKSD